MSLYYKVKKREDHTLILSLQVMGILGSSYTPLSVVCCAHITHAPKKVKCWN